jgi:hypothetical protein
MIGPISRRELLAGALAFGGSRLVASQTGGTLVANEPGGYLFVPGTSFLSLAVAAANGTTFRRPPVFPEGLDAVERHLRSAGRPIQALCGFELRNGRQAAVPEFMAFNDGYVERLRKAGVLVRSRMPLTRSNLVVTGTDTSHRIHAFSYTVRLSPPSNRPPTFVMSGIPDVNILDPKPEIVAKGDVSVNGLRQKTVFILDTIERLLASIGANWRDVTGIQLYSVRDIHPLIENVVLARIPDAASRGIQWHHVLLPVAGGDVEIGVRSVRAEFTIDG